MIEGPKRPRDRGTERERERERTKRLATSRQNDERQATRGQETRGQATSRRDERVACRAGGLRGDSHVAIAPRDDEQNKCSERRGVTHLKRIIPIFIEISLEFTEKLLPLYYIVKHKAHT